MHCFACRTVARRLHLPLVPVLPAHLCPAPGPLYSVLMGYKESPVEEVRRHNTEVLRAHFASFFDDHEACVTAALGGPPDLVLPVPSTHRPGPSPLEQALHGFAALTGWAAPSWAPSLLRRTSVPVGHMRPQRDAYAVADGARARIAGARVLLLDDSYVSGARSQSAASALGHAGARARLIVPLGRLLRPERAVAHATFAALHACGDARCARCVRWGPAPGSGPR